MFARSLFLSIVAFPALALADDKAITPPVTIGNEVELHKPGTKPEPPRSYPPLRVGVVPSLGQGAGPESEKLAKYLEQELGIKVKPQLFENHDAEANALVAGRIDLAWMPPLQAFNASIGGAQMVAKLVRKGASNYRSVFFVRADSPIKKLTDVKNATVGWVEANSATGRVFPLAMIAREHLTPSAMFKDEKYLGTHDAVCKAVWGKQVDLGATLADEAAAGSQIAVDGCAHSLGADVGKLRVIAVSEPVPNDVFAVRKGFDPATLAKVQKVLLAMPTNAAGKAVLHDSLKADGVAGFQPNDFDPVQHALEAASDVEGK